MTDTWNENNAVRGASGNGTAGSFTAHKHSKPDLALDAPDAGTERDKLHQENVAAVAAFERAKTAGSNMHARRAAMSRTWKRVEATEAALTEFDLIEAAVKK